MTKLKVLAGDFRKGQASMALGSLQLCSGTKAMPENIALSSVSSVEIATQESVVRIGGAAGWGAAGAALLGPLGFLAGALLGSRGNKTVFVCVLNDGRKFVAESDTSVYKKVLAAAI